MVRSYRGPSLDMQRSQCKTERSFGKGRRKLLVCKVRILAPHPLRSETFGFGRGWKGNDFDPASHRWLIPRKKFEARKGAKQRETMRKSAIDREEFAADCVEVLHSRFRTPDDRSSRASSFALRITCGRLDSMARARMLILC